VTDVALKEYFERRLADLSTHIDARFEWNDAAIAKAERTMNERLNSMNEFRDALKDQASRMATRAELNKLDDQLQQLQQVKANYEGRVLVTVSFVSLIISVATALAMRLIGS